MKAKIKFTDEIVEVIGYDSEKMDLKVKSEKDGRLFCVPFAGLEELKIKDTEREYPYVEVGETFNIDGHTLICKSCGDYCMGCFFDGGEYKCPPFCCPSQRKDGKNVMFVEVKDESKGES